MFEIFIDFLVVNVGKTQWLRNGENIDSAAVAYVR